MQTKQYLKLSHNSLKASSVARLLAVGAIASGSITAISVAPASAVLLNTGNLSISDGTSDFYAAGNPNVYSVTFNPFNLAFSSGVSGSFTPFFSNGGTSTLSPSTGTFNRVGATEVYSLAAPLDFSFTNGVTISFNTGSTFLRTFNNANGVGFVSNGPLSARAINGLDIVNVEAEAFTFSDANQDPTVFGGGTYGFTIAPIAATAIPEPFTIIGTLVGGTAALRMRKKLSDAAKH